jgi:ssDNA-binding Zn-finger/Zn-ribbon topoisomerase 1
MDFLVPESQTLAMEQSAVKRCPICNKPMVLALPPGGGQRTFRCQDCDDPDPLESEIAKGWLRGELGREKDAPL